MLPSVIRDYLLETRLRVKPQINLDKLIIKNFYTTSNKIPLLGLDIIPATMFDKTDSSYPKGLDDLEIEIAMQQMGDDTLFNHLTIISNFFKDTGIDKNMISLFLIVLQQIIFLLKMHLLFQIII